MKPRDIRKIYTDPALIAEYNGLEAEIRSLDAGYPLPPPVHVAAIEEMRGILRALQDCEA